MNIGQAAEVSGLSPKAIRYYETQGLVVPARATTNGYRDYSLVDIKRLVFLRWARAAGFGMDECRELLMVYVNPGQRSTALKENLLEKLARLDGQMAAMASMRSALEAMIEECGVTGGLEPSGSVDIASDLQSAGTPCGLTFRLLGDTGVA